ncbi:MAG: hypothetical protein NC344_10255 [Bacteroidales bacterium]|nr:hypothetical protein [Bacteroidales bacterium]MCM1148186.1 hypothetical protein [Bacteroidales bacterium]MCM1207087.1 hypothetical protein [Bacillota bacterium]MCM1510831.1 hypothetical protein [Clostridium sp.]
MFSNLRQGSQIYILHKCASTPFVEQGSVEGTSNPMTGYYPTLPNMPVNISIRTGEKVTPYQNLPPNAEIAEVANNNTGEKVMIVCTKEALNTEVHSMRQASVDAINSVEWHKQRISACDTLLQQINPEEMLKAQQQQEISDLKAQVMQMSQMMSQLTSQLKENGASSSKKKGD